MFRIKKLTLKNQVGFYALTTNYLKAIPLITILRMTKSLGIDLTKEMKDPYIDKTLGRESEGDNLKDISRFGIGRINIG